MKCLRPSLDHVIDLGEFEQRDKESDHDGADRGYGQDARRWVLNPDEQSGQTEAKKNKQCDPKRQTVHDILPGFG